MKEIKPQDIRLGNFVRFKKSNCSVTAISWNYGRAEVGLNIGLLPSLKYSPISPDQLEGIPLSEDILFKAGFVLNKDHDYWRNEEYAFYTEKRKLLTLIVVDSEFHVYYPCEDDMYSSWGRPIAFVHDLQNVFYFKTLEELEINL